MSQTPLQRLSAHLRDSRNGRLPLDLAVALIDLPSLWASSNDPTSMLAILEYLGRPLPVALALDAARLAVKQSWSPVNSRTMQLSVRAHELLDYLARLESGEEPFDYITLVALREGLEHDEEAADQSGHRSEAIVWEATRRAASAVLHRCMSVKPLEARDQRGHLVDHRLMVRLAVRAALNGGADRQTVLAWVHALGPAPTLDDVVHVLEANRVQ